METMEKIKESLSGHFGSDTIFHGPFTKSFKYTEGAKHFFEIGQCWWLHDILATDFTKALFTKDEIEKYYLTVTVSEKKKCVIDLKDYTGEVIFGKVVPWTTLPEGEIKLRLGYHGNYVICCLPSED